MISIVIFSTSEAFTYIARLMEAWFPAEPIVELMHEKRIRRSLFNRFVPLHSLFLTAPEANNSFSIATSFRFQFL